MKQWVAAIGAMVQRRQWGRLLAWAGMMLWAVGLCGYFFSTQPWTNLYVDNQHTYFIQGLRLSERHPYLENDWFAQTKPLHIAFTYLVAGLEHFDILQEGMIVFDIFFRLVFLLTIWLLVWAFWDFAGLDFSRYGSLRRAALTLGVLSFYVLSLWPVFQMSAFFEGIGITSATLVWEKFGFYYSFGGFAAFRYYTEPSSFSVLILTALALLPYRRWRLASALLGIAALFHASFLLHTGVIAACLALYLFFKGDKRSALHVIVIYAVFVLPLVMYILTQMTDPFSVQANQILTENRVPHHAIPSRWWDTTEWAHITVVIAGLALLAWKGRGIMRWLPAVIAGYGAVGIVYVALSHDLNVAILMPWRASGYLYVLVQLAVLTAGVYLVVKVLDMLHKYAFLSFLIVPVVLLGLGISSYGVFNILQEEYQDLTTYDLHPFYLQIRQETAPDAIFVTPEELVSFRLDAQRAQYVDKKSHPYKGTEVLAWWDRIAFLREFYADETIAAVRQQLCQTVGADYYLLETQPGESETVLLTYANWALIPCP